MSQDIWSTINPATTSGTQLATLLNDFKSALMSGLSGTSRPSELEAGGTWIDTTNAGTPNFYWSFKLYTGSVDIEIFRVDLAGNKQLFAGTSSQFQIEKISDTSVGGILKFLKERIAGGGQVLSGDIIGNIQFVVEDNGALTPTVAQVRMEANQDITGAAQGVRMIWEMTPDGASASAEWMRLVNARLGIGITVPETPLHVNTEGRVSKTSNDAVGAKLSLQKARIAGTGAAQAADVIGEVDFRAMDSTSAQALAGSIEASASEAHTDTAKGTIVKIKTATTGASTPSSKLEIGDIVETKVRHKVLAQEYVSQNVATTATIAQLSAANRIVEFTGSTATSVQGINSGQAAKIITLHNRSSADVTLKHENVSATAADRFTLPDTSDIVLSPDHSAEFFYCATTSRWKVKARTSASGSSGGGLNIVMVNPATDSPMTLTSADNGKVFVVKSALGAMVFVAPTPTLNIGFRIKDRDGSFDTNTCTLQRNATEKIEQAAADYLMNAAYGNWEFGADGTDWDIVGR